jgi:hypothetical protein
MSRILFWTLTTLFVPTEVAAARICSLALLTLVRVRHAECRCRLEVDTARDVGNGCGFYKGKSPQQPFPSAASATSNRQPRPPSRQQFNF